MTTLCARSPLISFARPRFSPPINLCATAPVQGPAAIITLFARRSATPADDSCNFTSSHISSRSRFNEVTSPYTTLTPESLSIARVNLAGCTWAVVDFVPNCFTLPTRESNQSSCSLFLLDGGDEDDVGETVGVERSAERE